MRKIHMVLTIFVFVSIMTWLNHQQTPVVEGKKRVGLCVMATGSYINYIKRLLDCADSYFLPGHEVTYFVFTDGQYAHPKARVIYQEQLGWPYDSMMRFHVYAQHAHLFEKLDYIYAIDADMGFVGLVGNEIFSDRVATVLSVHLFKPQKPYESNPLSTAYVHVDEGANYYAGAFYGGSRDEFIRLVNQAAQQVDIDLARGYIAWANDESHLNRYFVSNKPTLELSPSYCHFDHWQSPFERKIIAYDDKDYSKTRKQSMLNPLAWYKKILQHELCQT